MNILIAHFCTHWVQCSGGVEKATVGFALVNKNWTRN